jgi:hypothetical protein
MNQKICGRKRLNNVNKNILKVKEHYFRHDQFENIIKTFAWRD